MGYIRLILSAFFLILPRSVYTYPLYNIAPLLLFSVDRSQNIKFLLNYFLLVVFFCISIFCLSLFYNIFLTNFILELVMLTPLIFFLMGFGGSVCEKKSITAIRIISVSVFIFSMLNMVKNGFPLRLPYIDYLPDEFFGPYGIGGARIVTVVGFFSLIMEVKRGRGSLFYIVISLVNFIAPSYILGICAGAGSIAVYVLRRGGWLYFIVIGFLLLPAAYYAVDRLSGMNMMIFDAFGLHPKLIAYKTIFDFYFDNPHLLLTGAGLGQFSSSPALWGNEVIRFISIQDTLKLPGLGQPHFQDIYLNGYFELAYENIYALSSALNKPYTSISTLIIELGLLVFIIFLIVF